MDTRVQAIPIKSTWNKSVLGLAFQYWPIITKTKTLKYCFLDELYSILAFSETLKMTISIGNSNTSDIVIIDPFQ